MFRKENEPKEQLSRFLTTYFFLNVSHGSGFITNLRFFKIITITKSTLSITITVSISI